MSRKSDRRPIDLNAIIDLLEEEIENAGETGIWGDYGPPAAPLDYLIRLLRDNADAIENRVGDYVEG